MITNLETFSNTAQAGNDPFMRSWPRKSNVPAPDALSRVIPG